MNDTTQAVIPCNLCGGGDVSVLSMRSRSGRPLRTVACRGCGLVWSDPRPHDARQFYEDEYRLAYKQAYVPKPKHVLRAGRVALSRLDRIRAWLRPGMRVLDVGSGGGEFAYLLRTLGCDVQGVEPNRGYAGYAASQYGLDIRLGFIGDVDLPDAGYDLITIWHVLEHTEDPAAVLRQLRRALRPGGILVVEVPNVEATCQSPASTFHEAHLYNFNTATLDRMAARAGLQSAATELSADGGNITAVFRAAHDAVPAGPVDPVLRGNHDRVVDAVRGHTTAAHWLSLHPYRRLAGRIARALGEWRDTRHAASGRERLDALYAGALAAEAPSTQGLFAGRPLWQLVAGSYVVALVLEWALLDELLPRHGWTEQQGVLLYVALLAPLIAGVAAADSRPRTRRHFAKLASWAVPLLALPAYC
jgi:2-polyprenyl-3-methyl-5-hydroxy-6-metoxy-1,4-benzoquinol methylase